MTISNTKIRNRKLSLESLEQREMLSIDPVLPLAVESPIEQIAPPEPPAAAAALTPQEAQVQSQYEHNLVDTQGLTGYAKWTTIDGVSRLTEINAANKSLSGSVNLSGCTELKSVDLSNNRLSSVNVSVSGNAALETLNVSNNRLLTLTGQTSLDTLNLTGQASLNTLIVNNNSLKTIALSTNTALKVLNCASNQLETLNLSTNTELTNLTCDNNQLTALVLTENPNLKSLSCSNNKLTDINLSTQNSLDTLECSNNQLASLTLSNSAKLSYLSCEANKLTSLTPQNLTALDESSVLRLRGNQLSGSLNLASLNLTTLDCSNNNITSITVASANLVELNCSNNNMAVLNVANKAYLETLDCSGNQLTTLNVTNCTALASLDCYDNRLTTLPVSGLSNLTTLNCYNNRLTALDVSGLTKLSSLSCSGNNLTSLSVSNCTALISLDCNGNNLTSLNVSTCTALTFLDCSGNNLTSLNVSNCTALTFLDCNGNNLTSLNVTSCKALISLDCSDNRLEGEDKLLVGDLKALEELNCRGNNLIKLNVTSCTALISLDCSDNNKLEALTVFDLTNLKELDCSGDKLTTLSVIGLTALTSLDCSWNELTALNTSVLTALNYLDCSWNELTTLNVSNSTKLITLDCSNNRFDTLDVSGLTALISLYCINNYQLTSLDVSGCTALVTLNCYDNELTSLNVSSCTALIFLDCSGNDLASLNVSALTALVTLNCYDNQLTSLNVSNCTKLALLDCNNNQLTSLNVLGLTALNYLDCSENDLTSLDIRNVPNSNTTTLTELYCNGNKLTFATLQGLPGDDVTVPFIGEYSSQQEIPVTSFVQSNFTGLQSQYNVAGKKTFTWYYANGTAIDPSLVTNNAGSFTFNASLVGQSIYCELTNDAFPSLTLKTATAPVVSLIPGIPQVIKISQSSSNVTLTWTTVPDADRYGVYRKVNGKWTLLGYVSPAATTFTENNVPAGLQTYAVRAFKGTAYSDYQEGVTINVDTTTPGIPQVDISQSSGNVTLTWAAIPTADHYSVSRLVNGKWVTLNANVTATTFTENNVPDGLQTYRVQAFRGPVYSSPGEVTITVNRAIIGVPQVEISQSNGSVTLTWAAISGADHYGVYRKVGNSWFAVDANVTDTTKTEDNVPAGRQTYAVRAFKGTVYSDYQQGVIIDVDPATPGVPQVTPSQTNSIVTLTWAAIPNADRYGVYRLVNGKWTLLSYVTTETFTESAPLEGSQTYAVRAFTNGNMSDYKAVSIDVTIGIPQVTLSQENGNVTLTWAQIIGAEYYRVYRLVNGKWTSLGTAAGGTFTENAVPEGLQIYAVRAFKSTSGGSSVMSDYQSVSINVIAGLGIPQVTATSANGNVMLNWEMIPNADRYGVYRLDAGRWTFRGYVTDTTFTDNAAPGGFQTYAVRAFDGQVMSEYQRNVTINVVAGLDVPQVTATLVNGKVTLAWAAIAGADRYGIYRLVNNKWTFFGYYVTIPTFTDNTDLTGTGLQTYAVRAFQGTLMSDFQPVTINV